MSIPNIAQQLINRGATIEEAARRSGMKVSEVMARCCIRPPPPPPLPLILPPVIEKMTNCDQVLRQLVGTKAERIPTLARRSGLTNEQVRKALGRLRAGKKVARIDTNDGALWVRV